MPDPYQQALAAAGLRVSNARGGINTPQVAQTLAETETPGTFEQAFRFLGRPGFAVRSGLSGDLGGMARNVGQFLNEAFFLGAGALNPDLTLTGVLSHLPGVDLPKDITSRDQRPEFTDLLKRWGVTDPKYMGPYEKVTADIVGGFFTDPLSLAGGVVKGVASSALKAMGPRLAQAAMWTGLSAGGTAEIRAGVHASLGAILKDSAARLPSLSRYTPQTLEQMISDASTAAKAAGMDAAGIGEVETKAAKLVRRLQGKAAERYMYEQAAKTGVDLRPVTRTYVPTGDWRADYKQLLNGADKTKALASIPLPFEGLNPSIKTAAREGLLRTEQIMEDGAPATILFSPRNEALALRLQRKTQLLDAIGRPDEWAKKLDDARGLARTAIQNTIKAAKGLGPTGEAALRRDIGMLYGYSDDAIRDHLLSKGLPDVVTGLESWSRKLEELPAAYDAGLKALYARGLPEPGGISFLNPFSGEYRTLKWEKIYRGITGPGLISGGLLGKQPAMVMGQIEEWTKATVGWAKNQFIDHFSATGGIPAWLEKPMKAAVWAGHVAAGKSWDQAERFAMQFDPNERKTLFRGLDMAGDEYQKKIFSLGPNGDAMPQVVADAERIRKATLDSMAGLQGPAGDFARAERPIPHSRPTFEAALSAQPDFVRDAFETISRKQIASEVDTKMMSDLLAAFPTKGREATEAIALWRAAMREVPPYMRFGAKWEADLKKFSPEARAAWEAAVDNPFYAPHQLSKRLREALDQGMTGETPAGKINDVFTRARKYPTREAFLQALEGTADQLGLDLSAVEDVADDLMEEDFAVLYGRRMTAAAVTKSRQTVYQLAADAMTKHGGAVEDYQYYVNRVLHPVHDLDWATGQLKPGGSSRRNFIGKILGGGQFTIPMPSKEVAERWAQKDFFVESGAKPVPKGGKWGLQFDWIGFGRIYKPPLTSIPLNLKYRVRNLMAGPFMMQFSPGMGDEGLAALRAVTKHGQVRELTLGNPLRALHGPITPFERPELERLMTQGQSTVVAMRMLNASTVAERDAALGVLTTAGWRIGNRSAAEVLDAMRLIKAGSPLAPADLTSGVDLVKLISDRVAGITPATRGDLTRPRQVLAYLRKTVEHGEALAAETEATMRITAMLAHLRQGRDPVEAASLINMAFVDYSRQSAAERFVRDFFPFARFMLGSTQWIKPMLENPVVTATLGTAQRSLSPPGEQQLLPTEAQESIALPLPWKDAEGNYQFITSLGLPHEAAMQMLGAVASDEARRKYVLGAIHPLPRIIAEAQTGHTFYHNTEFGSYRRAPAFFPDIATTRIPGREGRPDTHEISGYANEIFNALPTAGVQSTVDRLFDGRRAWWNKLAVTTMGVRTVSVDLQRELKRRVAKYLEDKVASGQIGEVQAFFTRQDPDQVPADLRIMLDALSQERSNARRRSGR